MADRPNFIPARVPEPLRDLAAWLCWRFEGFECEPKPRKVPYWANGGRRFGAQGSDVDKARLVTFADAKQHAIRRGMTGIGFAVLAEWGVVALDFDNCIDDDGNMPEEIRRIAHRTYSERSPSGRGVRVLLMGNLGNHKSPSTDTQYGFETFSSSGYVTLTGDFLTECQRLGLENTVADVDDFTRQFCEARFGALHRLPPDPNDPFIGHAPRLGMEKSKIEALLAKLDPDIGRGDWIRVGAAVHHETYGHEEGFDIWNDWSALGGKYVDEEDLRKDWASFDRRDGSHRPQATLKSVLWMLKEGGYEFEGAEEAIASDWNVPAPLPDTLPSVSTLEPDMLPGELRPWLIDIAQRMSLPLDFVAVPAMVMVGSLVGRKVVVRPEEFTDWSEAGNLWGVIVAQPGALKTPSVREVFRPLRILEAEAQEQNERALEAYQTALSTHKLVHENAMKAAKKQLESGSEAGVLQALEAVAAEPKKPRLKRFITSDATVEKLGEICADNPNGVLWHRDELLTLLTDLEKEEKAPARGFLLSGWTGMDPYTFDRIGRGTVHIPAVNISLFGTAQPQRIASFIAQSLQKKDDGMVQRLQMLVWPDSVGEWVSADRPPDEQAWQVALECCRRLSTLDHDALGAECDGNLPFLRLSPEARELFTQYRVTLEAKVRSQDQAPAMAAHLAKFRGLVPRLSLILHLAGSGTGQVAASAMAQALRWAEYLEAHARRAYAALDAEKADMARLIWQRVKSGDLEDGFTARDIYQKGWSGLQIIDCIQQALATLVEHEWLRPDRVKTRGRPKVTYRINPRAIGG